MKKTIVIAMTLLTSGCATMNNTQKTLFEMAGAGIVAGVVGAVTSPKDENAVAHAALWGGLAAAGAGAVGLYVNSDQEKLDLQAKQIEALKREVEVAEHGHYAPIASSSTALEKSPPKEFARLIKNGGWEFSEVDEWEKVSDSEAIHKDKRAILIPAQFTFGK